MPLLRWVTNIPAPYRNHRYRVMAQVLPEFGFDLEVVYQARTEHDRHWVFSDEELDHPHRFLPGLHPVVRGIDLHINPTLPAAVRSPRADVLVSAGWSTPSAVLSALSLPRGGVRLLSSETNPTSSSVSAGWSRRARRAVVNRFDGYVVPGERAAEYLRQIDPRVGERPFLALPNIVDEDAFCEGVDNYRAGREALRAELGVAGQMWICPARLEPRKGLHLFLPLLRGVEGVTLVVCGTGSQEAELAALAEGQDLPVRLLGHLDPERILELYAAADLFVLPSLRDPSPLSAVEAAAAGLPLLLSQRAGNVEDLVDEGSGWVYEPDQPEAMAEVVSRIASLSPAELSARGKRARERFEEGFASRPRVEDFARAVSELVNGTSGRAAPGAGRPGGSVSVRRRARRGLDATLGQVARVSPSPPGRIIYYHSVHPDLPGSHRPGDFAAQMRWLSDNGWTAVRMDQIPEAIAGGFGERWVAVTFDDGYRDNLEFALDPLQEVGFPATVYVVTQLVDEGGARSEDGYRLYPGREMLRPKDLEELAGAGIEIASHGHTHRPARELVEEGEDLYLGQLRRSRELLESWTGGPARSYAYPFGQQWAFDDRTRRIAGEAGFSSVSTTLWGSPTPGTDLLGLPRCEMRHDDSFEEFVAKMSGRREHKRFVHLIRGRRPPW